MSLLPKSRLPQSVKQDGAEVICRLEYTFKNIEMKAKNRHWYSRGPKYLTVEFDVKVIPGAADLRFKICSKAGLTCSADHEAIDVKWDLPLSEEKKKANNEDESGARLRRDG